MSSSIPVSVDPPAPDPGPSSLSASRWPFSLYNRFSAWRKALDLPNPGTSENLTKEAKNTLLNNYLFDGARADLSKSLSMNPAFNVTHSFTLGSQTAPPAYHFGAIFANENLFLHGNIDNDGSMSGRINQGWTANNVTKAQAQLSSQAGQNFFQVEHDYQGSDYTLNAKAVNPSPADGTGIYIGSYLQSFTKNLALGVEAVLQRPSPDMADVAAAYMVKYTSTDRNWIATAQVQGAGILQATYWQKLSDKVDVAADLQLVAGQGRRDALASLAARYELRMASFRAQVDSTGKVAAHLEQRFAPTFSFLVSGEIDHFKNAAKVGVGVMIESASFTPEEMALMPPPPGSAGLSAP
ncbi:mitochondrial import receptor subunit tom40 [Dichomitus squalens]|uniref:Mitochondrial import receptor subunit tom40 n=1 Tax=Dichomitus squalens TaxID=114155 RepID=A0A4Q9QD67_9APHY|nr:mitochondrial import receptor subunit tom40 [Dichomitus squalens LYAD-421 SS1]EJF66039.1 mitochondrial import receptor subunit tom40 [Dichomitus squalens LYAD-421 SS1]TBU35771.1 mitochondrial import receptor subunit tom40 [Dichomitus squalens]TBU36921.1 mitochondrial import receptor subunit tom40 [Dichomitus squalens]TBU65615.1 mitochondrial import receptor subunit tom40 [Dichomitus squalens]